MAEQDVARVGEELAVVWAEGGMRQGNGVRLRVAKPAAIADAPDRPFFDNSAGGGSGHLVHSLTALSVAGGVAVLLHTAEGVMVVGVDARHEVFAMPIQEEAPAIHEGS